MVEGVGDFGVWLRFGVGGSFLQWPIVLRAVVHGRGEKGELVDRFGLPEDGVVAILADDEFVGHAAGGCEAPIDGEVARAAQGVDEAGSAGKDRLAGVDDVAEAIVAAPGETAIDGVPAVQNLVELDGLIVLAFGCLRAEGVAGGVEAVASGEVVGQRLVLDLCLHCGVETDVLGIARLAPEGWNPPRATGARQLSPTASL